MKSATLFSGVGAPECAMPGLDWCWCAEIDPFASAVHAARFSGVPNLGDVTEIDPDTVEPVDLVVFGSPCQSFSVAGRRLGLDDPRGNLALVALRLVERLRPRWFLFENVPGLLSSDSGRDFGAFLGAVEQCGYGWAYRTLDAQHFGVPQRRRRVFVVGCLGDWRGAAAVLFEPESLRGDPAPRREAGERAAPILEAGARTGVSTTDPRADIGIGEPGDPMFTIQRGKQHAVAFGGNRQSGALDVATAVNAHGGPHGRLDFESETFVTHPLRADGFDASEDGMSVRRLTPREAERLQGFPDDFTLIRYRGKPAADGPRYRALGNSMAVPVLHWLLRRIEAFDM